MIRFDANLVSQLGPNTLNENLRSKSDNSGVSNKSQAQISTYQYTHSDKKSFTMFEHTVHRRMEQSVDAKFPASKVGLEEAEFERREERADLAANNILKFVELRLKHDVKDGATTEELSSRLEAALEGFEQGYSEANDILKDMNMLSEEVEADVSLTKDKVLAGLAALKDQYIGLDDEQEDASKDPSELQQSDRKSETSTQPSFRQSIDPLSSNYSSIEAGEARDFSFALETKDGDIVTINASSLMAFQAESSRNANGTEFGQSETRYLSAQKYSEDNFAFSVTGELDESELAAINDILSSVNDLASDFYSGDMNSAFEKALKMGYDSNEISGFAFSMTRVTSVKAMQAYQPEQEILKPNVISELRPIGRFASELSRSLTVAKEHFAHPQNLLSSIIEQMQMQISDDEQETSDTNNDNPNPSFQEFTQSLLLKLKELDDLQPDSRPKGIDLNL